jgi:predicted nucleic acid-binding Zn ribbon protein
MAEYITGVDRCVCCGAVIPEGGWVCLNCVRFTVTAGGRRSGKTAHILNRADLTGAVVIVKDEHRKTQLEEQAKRMGLPSGWRPCPACGAKMDGDGNA